MAGVVAPVLRRTEPDWEAQVLAARAEGRPFRVACHKDPLPRLRRLARCTGHGSGYALAPRVRLLLFHALRDAHAEGYSWSALARVLGLHSDQAAMYYAGRKLGATGVARWYLQHAGDAN